MVPPVVLRTHLRGREQSIRKFQSSVQVRNAVLCSYHDPFHASRISCMLTNRWLWVAIGELVRNGASDLWWGRTDTYYVVHIEVWSIHTPYTLVLIRVRVGAFPRHHWQGLNFAKRRCKIYQPKPPSLSLPYLHPPCFNFLFCSCSCPCSSVFSHFHRFLLHLMPFFPVCCLFCSFRFRLPVGV